MQQWVIALAAILACVCIAWCIQLAWCRRRTRREKEHVYARRISKPEDIIVGGETTTSASVQLPTPIQNVEEDSSDDGRLQDEKLLRPDGKPALITLHDVAQLLEGPRVHTHEEAPPRTLAVTRSSAPTPAVAPPSSPMIPIPSSASEMQPPFSAPELAPEPVHPPSSPPGFSMASHSSIAISIDSPATPNLASPQRWERLRKESMTASSPASRDAGSPSRAELLRLIQQAAEESIKTNAAEANAGEMDAEPSAGDAKTNIIPGSSHGGHKPRSLIESFCQSEDEPSPGASPAATSEVLLDAAAANLERARSASSSPSGSSVRLTPLRGLSARAISFRRSHAKLPTQSAPTSPDDNAMKV